MGNSNPENRIKTLTLIVASALLVGCTKPQVQSDWDKGREALMRELTNEVVGVHRIIEVNYNGPYNVVNGGEVSNSIMVDFVNKLGGIERTNLPCISYLYVYTNHEGEIVKVPSCHVDDMLLYRRRMEEIERKYK